MNTPNHTDLVFQTLASKPRRQIMDLVKQMPGCSVNDICEHFTMSRIGVMKHIQLLVEARLLISRKKGRTREFFFNAAPIQMIYDRWTDEYSAFWVTQAVDLKYQIENKNQQATTQKSQPGKTGTSSSKKPRDASASNSEKKTRKKPTKKRKKKAAQ